MSAPVQNSFRADLHCHTTCSDGSLTSEQLLTRAKEIGLSAISITDHDSIESYVTALDIARNLDLILLPGVEFSTEFKGHSIHILAYSFNVTDQLLHQFCAKHSKRRQQRNLAILEQLTLHGMPLTEEDVIASLINDPSCKHTIGRPHIAQAMVRKKYVENLRDAFKLYIGEGKPCYVRGELSSLEETLDLIHRANGLAVIAHPHLIKNDPLIQQLLELPFDGIECFYSKSYPWQNERWLRVAQKKDWLVTGGSDFHGDLRIDTPLGCAWIEEAFFKPLYQHYLQNLA